MRAREREGKEVGIGTGLHWDCFHYPRFLGVRRGEIRYLHAYLHTSYQSKYSEYNSRYNLNQLFS